MIPINIVQISIIGPLAALAKRFVTPLSFNKFPKNNIPSNGKPEGTMKQEANILDYDEGETVASKEAVGDEDARRYADAKGLYLDGTRTPDIEKAREQLTNKIDIQSEGLAIIPTEWKTEVFCYEFKGKVEDVDFIAYINAETDEEEDILIITNTPNGTVTE